MFTAIVLNYRRTKTLNHDETDIHTIKRYTMNCLYQIHRFPVNNKVIIEKHDPHPIEQDP